MIPAEPPRFDVWLLASTEIPVSPLTSALPSSFTASVLVFACGDSQENEGVRLPVMPFPPPRITLGFGRVVASALIVAAVRRR